MVRSGHGRPPAGDISIKNVMPWREALRTPTEVAGLLRRTYDAEMAATATDYLRTHSSPDWIANHVRVFEWYRRYIAAGSRVLDWGCQHGPDSVLVRAYCHPAALHGCDHCDEHEYPVFRQASGVRYQKLTDPVALPYADHLFDVVIGSGVLEHVPQDVASTHEIYRVLRPGGVFIITYLPNWWSVTERGRRRSGCDEAHERLYRRHATARQLGHAGFRVLESRYQTFGGAARISRIGSRRLQRLAASAVGSLLPVYALRAPTLCLVAEKVTSFR